MSWSGWALPWGSDGLLMPVGLYATDVLEMARQFVELAGLGRRSNGPRSLDAFLSDENQVVMAVEDRNKACIQASFFSNAFHGKLEEHASAGKLDVGFGQFFDFGEEAGYGPTSYFVSAEGFFYVLCYRAADGECFKGDFDDDKWTYRAGSRAACTIQWVGEGPDDFNLLWDGMQVERALVATKTTTSMVLALRLSRWEDSKGRPWSVTLARCSSAGPLPTFFFWRSRCLGSASPWLLCQSLQARQ
ncbi:unnamed protein product [Cladocopium goreaui]|uniref:Uncharacterized protein n=1 Tax=Cladocopium goreaui TaxID=2562237 RepID=A0A9P1GJS0_9DINO|nr:unnamed protein product [Cladocopium goreaui]